jgi:short-subunit dehydrogenase
LSKIHTYEDYAKIIDEVTKDKDIGLLVNNAGLGQSGPFIEVDGVDRIQNMINVNALHPVYLTKAMLNKNFLQRKHRSGIINVSSVMGRTNMPSFQIYGATKRLLSYFSKILANESKMLGHTVDVLDYRPAFMATKLSGQSESLIAPSTEVCAKASLDALQLTRRSNGLFIHHISEYAMEWADWFIPGPYYKSFYKEGRAAWIKETTPIQDS